MEHAGNKLLFKKTHIHTPTYHKTHTHTHTLQTPHIHTSTHYKTHTYTHPHITKPTHPHIAKPTHTHTHTLQNPHIHTSTHYKPTHTHTRTLQNKLKQPQHKIHTKWNSHTTIKYPQHKVTPMYLVLLSPRTSCSVIWLLGWLVIFWHYEVRDYLRGDYWNLKPVWCRVDWYIFTDISEVHTSFLDSSSLKLKGRYIVWRRHKLCTSRHGIKWYLACYMSAVLGVFLRSLGKSMSLQTSPIFVSFVVCCVVHVFPALVRERV